MNLKKDLVLTTIYPCLTELVRTSEDKYYYTFCQETPRNVLIVLISSVQVTRIPGHSLSHSTALPLGTIYRSRNMFCIEMNFVPVGVVNSVIRHITKAVTVGDVIGVTFILRIISAFILLICII